jgi:TRAP-type C4-dicarboxylate transport system permease small subunit
MRAFVAGCRKLTAIMDAAAEVFLVIMLMLTVLDVCMRVFNRPIVGTYELVAVAGAMVIGFAVPRTSWERGHVSVDFLMENRSSAVKNGFFIATRITGSILFALLSWNLLQKGIHLYKTGEVSLTLHIPYYPAAYGLALCFFVECLTLVADIFRTASGDGQAPGEEP